jgi:hypothetical protein
MTDKTVLWEASDGVGRVTLNRPDSLNAWTAEFGSELKEIVEGPAADDELARAPLGQAVHLEGAALADDVDPPEPHGEVGEEARAIGAGNGDSGRRWAHGG